MSAQPESMPEIQKPKRGRPARKVAQTAPTEKTELPEFQCAIPMDTYFEETPSGEKAKRHHTCTNESQFVPMVTLTGQRREENPPGSKIYVIRSYKFPIRYGAVCKEHMEAIKKDVRVLLSGQELQTQEGNMKAIGLPKPSPQLTKITFQAFIPPESDVESEHMDQLLGNLVATDDIETL